MSSEAVTEEGLPNFVKETAVRWLQTIESEENLPADLNKLEQVALERLGLRSDQGNISGLIDIPWQKTFEKFLINLNINFSEIPQTHFLSPCLSIWHGRVNFLKPFLNLSKVQMAFP